ncbi:glycerophosphodiester phosphodiesterase family protein [Olivibacter ginsenosidimutans]
MQSIEADVFLRGDTLFVAHEKQEIRPGRTLETLYLHPLVAAFRQHQQHPFPDTNKTLQLVIDIKENYQQVISALLKILDTYEDVFKPAINLHAVRIVLSGDLPTPDSFSQYPSYISFDGRPEQTYTAQQLQRIAMISQDIKHYTQWNGKENLSVEDQGKLIHVIQAAHQQGKPVRFWATTDRMETWMTLERLGVDWINTDHPEELASYYQQHH